MTWAILPIALGPLLADALDSRDTLFRRGIGRTDLWGGDSELIFRSLRNRLMTLDENTHVIAGHGPPTTIGEERRANPFLRVA